MMPKIASLVLATLCVCSGPCFGTKMMNPKDRSVKRVENGPAIKVLLHNEVPSALLEVKGDYKVFRPDAKGALSFGHNGKRFLVHAMKDGLRWGEEYPDVFEISVEPQNPDAVLYVNGMQYKGKIIVSQTPNNRIVIVNEVPIEDYIKSLLAYKVKGGLSQEAMAALVITARTEAHFISQTLDDEMKWHVVAKEVGYFGHGVTMRENGVDQGCEWTRYMVMRYLPKRQSEGTTFAAKWSGERGEHATQKLSITGAEKMACRGYDAKKILQAYFPKTKIALLVNPNEEIR